MMGTALGQALPFLASPLLTRLYSEEDFALFTSFFAVSSILIVAAGGRYQLAILLPRRSRDATRLFFLSFYITVAFSVVLLLAAHLLLTHPFNILGSAAYLVPAYVLLFGLWHALSYLAIRKKKYFQNAVSKIWQSGTYVVVGIVLGKLHFLMLGLIYARILGTLSATIFLFRKMMVKLAVVKLSTLRDVARTYSDYPKYSLLPAILDVMSMQALVLILSWYYSVPDLGHYGLTALVLSAPLGLIGTSFRDVFFQRMATLVRNNEPRKSMHFFLVSATGLFAAGLPVLIILHFFGPEIFGIIFGERWTRAGEFASILSISFVLHLVVGPLSSVFNATNSIKKASAWHTLYFITTFITLGITAKLYEARVEVLFSVYVVHELVLYSLYFILQYQTLRNYSDGNARSIGGNREEGSGMS